MAVRKEQMPVEKEKKIRIPLWIYPSVEDRIMKNFEADNCKSPSEFIEKAKWDQYKQERDRELDRYNDDQRRSNYE